MGGVTIALVGTGDLGSWILELLSRSKGISKIAVLDLNETKGRLKAYSAETGAAYWGCYPDICFQKVDLNDIDSSAEIFKKIQPDVVVSCVSTLPWWVREALPPDVYEKVFISGPWIPGHLFLARNVMAAISQANIKTHVVQCGFPDGVNPALAGAGLSPTVGGGNSDLLVPGICKSAGDELGVPAHNISVTMIAHHFHVMSLIRYGSVGGAPYFLRVMLGDQDVTSKLNQEKILVEAVRTFHQEAEWNPAIASSFVKNVLAIANDTGEITHAAGPNGLPGGWPVRLSAKGAEVLLPTGLDEEQAMKIVEEAQTFDGIEQIKEDGTIVLTKEIYTTMKEIFGYDCREFSVENAHIKAEELLTRLKRFKDSL